MIAIVRIGELKGTVGQYALRVDGQVLAIFEHDTVDGLSVCLVKASRQALHDEIKKVELMVAGLMAENTDLPEDVLKAVESMRQTEQKMKNIKRMKYPPPLQFAVDLARKLSNGTGQSETDQQGGPKEVS